MTDASEALKALGIDVNEAIETDKALLVRKIRDSRICLCGHSKNRHTDIQGRTFCKPTKMDCPCKKQRYVLEAEDTRMFLRKTVGGGAMHALVRGLTASIQAGKKATWIIELVCDRCGSVDEIVTPVPVTQHGVISSEATGYDALVCATCRESV